MTSQLRTLSLRRVIAGLIAIVCFVQAARLFLAPQLATEAAASVAQPQPAPLPRYVPIPIEQIREGDYVLTRDDHTGEFTSKPVVQSFRRTSDHLRRVEIRTHGGEFATIQTTNEHPFWVEGKGWTNAAELQPDDTVTDETGQAVLVASTSYDPHDEGVAVFNFEVADTHSYYVQAPNARGPPVWVHNANCGDFLSLEQFEADARAFSIQSRQQGKKAISLGKDIPGGGYKELALHTGTSRYQFWEQDGITRRTVKHRFGRAFHQAADRASVIHFSLDGIDDVSDAIYAGRRGFRPKIGNMTNAELHYLYSNPTMLDKTIFYRTINGQQTVVPTPLRNWRD